MDTIETRLARMGITLPTPAAPAANYVPAVQHGGVMYVSGQICSEDGKVAYTGQLGSGGLSVEDGRKAARICAVNLLAQAKAALDGDLGRIKQILRVTVFVSSEPGFTEQHVVANGCSDLLVEALGEAGRHARAAVGMAALPLGASVEADAILAIG